MMATESRLGRPVKGYIQMTKLRFVKELAEEITGLRPDERIIKDAMDVIQRMGCGFGRDNEKREEKAKRNARIFLGFCAGKDIESLMHDFSLSKYVVTEEIYRFKWPWLCSNHLCLKDRVVSESYCKKHRKPTKK